MTAQSAHEYDADGPAEILRVLPSQFLDQFLAEYDAAVTGRPPARALPPATSPAAAVAAARRGVRRSGFGTLLKAVQDVVRTGRREGTPIDEVVPDWAEWVAASRLRADQ